MSSKLVRKLLHQTSELEAEKTEATDPAKVKGSKKRKRPTTSDETTVSVDKNDLLQRHIESKIRLDQTIKSRSKLASNKSVTRVEKERKTRAKLRSKALQVDAGIGNSRGSSSQKARKRHEPTFNKKRHEAEKKEKMLRDIAKLLKKRTKKR